MNGIFPGPRPPQMYIRLSGEGRQSFLRSPQRCRLSHSVLVEKSFLLRRISLTTVTCVKAIFATAIDCGRHTEALTFPPVL